MHVAAHTVLRAVQSRKLHARRLVQDVDGTLELIVHTRGIGDESDALALQDVEIAVAQHLHAGEHLRGHAQRACRHKYSCND